MICRQYVRVGVMNHFVQRAFYSVWERPQVRCCKAANHKIKGCYWRGMKKGQVDGDVIVGDVRTIRSVRAWNCPQKTSDRQNQNTQDNKKANVKSGDVNGDAGNGGSANDGECEVASQPTSQLPTAMRPSSSRSHTIVSNGSHTIVSNGSHVLSPTATLNVAKTRIISHFRRLSTSMSQTLAVNGSVAGKPPKGRVHFGAKVAPLAEGRTNSIALSSLSMITNVKDKPPTPHELGLGTGITRKLAFGPYDDDTSAYGLRRFTKAHQQTAVRLTAVLAALLLALLIWELWRRERRIDDTLRRVYGWQDAKDTRGDSQLGAINATSDGNVTELANDV